MQEVEVQMNFPGKLLNCGDYNLELELNTVKKRTVIYLKKDIKYTRRIDLEKENLQIVIGVIVDVGLAWQPCSSSDAFPFLPEK